MPDQIAPLDLATTRITMGFETFGESVRSDYTGHEELVRSGVGRFAGTISWTGADPSAATTIENDRDLAGWHLTLGGLDNVVEYTLPVQYRADLPEGANAQLSSLTLAGGRLTAVIALTGNEGRFIEPRKCVNIGGRLFVVRSRNGDSHDLFPRIVPAGRTLKAIRPTVRMRLDGTQPHGYIGQIVPDQSYRWVEVPL